ncbi:MAG: hypothetical protein GY940_44960, partial [bacterium]|nr:hypothetical protein [bacterium]
MPHLVLEYTGNIQQEVDFQDMFSRFHSVLSDTGGININNCKSRAVKLDHYYIGGGMPGQAFLHLEVRFLEGRAAALKQE